MCLKKYFKLFHKLCESPRMAVQQTKNHPYNHYIIYPKRSAFSKKKHYVSMCLKKYFKLFHKLCESPRMAAQQTTNHP